MAKKSASKTSKKKQKAAPKKRRSSARDVIGIALLAFSALLILAVLSFHPDDPFLGMEDPPQNRLGLVGAYVACALILTTFGRYISLALPLLCIVFAIELIRSKGFKWTWRIGFPLIFAAVLAATVWGVFAVTSPEDVDPYVRAGFVGAELAKLTLTGFGKTGAILILSAIALIFLTVFLGIRWAKVMDRGEKVGAKVGRGLGKAGQKLKREKKEKKPNKTNNPEDDPDEIPIADTYDDDEETHSEPPEESFDPITLAEPEDDDPPSDAEIVLDQIKDPERDHSKTPAALAAQRDEEANGKKEKPEYAPPPVTLLVEPDINPDAADVDEEALRKQATLLEQTLEQFGVSAKVIAIHPGPVITRYDLKPGPGVKVGRIASLDDDLAMALASPAVRIQAPIPGAGAVGIEVPNHHTRMVYLREVVDTKTFRSSDKPLLMALGRTAQGDIFCIDLAKMPHMLIAGTTGSGKSVCINTIIASLLLRNKPEDVLVAMVDPKKLELSAYAELRKHHLLFVDDADEVIATEPKNAVALLQSIVSEMERRYTYLAEVGVRSIGEFNEFVEKGKVKPDEDGNEAVKMPYIVLIVDELADLMLTAAKEVEEPIARLAQMARAVGIHLVVATQRPSVDVITGVIKANFPARLAFMVASKIDSRTILDRPGAESLLGKGDALLMTNASPQPVRLHGAFISTEEVHRLIAHVANQPAFVKTCKLEAPADSDVAGDPGNIDDGARDVLFEEAVKLVVRHQQGSVSLIQRRLKVGYSRAGRILDQLEQAGIVGPFEGSKAREVMIGPEDIEDYV